jgi:hypothetical protein
MSVALTRQTSLLEQLLQATINPAYEEIGDSAQGREWEGAPPHVTRPTAIHRFCTFLGRVASQLDKAQKSPTVSVVVSFASVLIATRPQMC